MVSVFKQWWAQAARRPLAWLIWSLGLLFVAEVALLATNGLQHSLSLLDQALGGSRGHWLWWAALPLLAGAGLWGLRRLRPAACGSLWALAAGLGALVAVRVAMAATWDAPLVSDFLEYRQLAEGVLAGGAWFSELRPMGYPLLLAGAYALGGDHVWTGELLNVGLALLTGGLLYGLVRRTWGAPAAGIALWLYALCPAQALMCLPLGTEIAYGAALMGALWAAVEARNGRWGLAIAAGLLLGLSQYLRPTSMALLPAFLALPFLCGLPWRRAAAMAGATACAFVLVLTPVGLYNQRQGGHFSLSTSNFGGWSLYVGANQKHDGAWNAEDSARMTRLPLRQMDRVARQEALKRIQADPAGYAALIGRKFPSMWAFEHYAPYWVMGTASEVPERPMAIWMFLSQAFYALVLGLAVLGLLSERQPSATTLLILASSLLVAAMHALMEVQARYHFYVVPLFIALAAAGAARLHERAQSLEARVPAVPSELGEPVEA